MPRVGSSKMIARGCIASHFASTTFCWLPPESVPTGVSTSGARMPSRRRPASASAVLGRAVDEPEPAPAPASCGSEMFSATEKSSTTPQALRSSGTR